MIRIGHPHRRAGEHRAAADRARATATTDDGIAPPLKDPRDPFVLALQRAEEEANQILDDILNERDEKLVERLDLGLRNREVSTEADVEAKPSRSTSRVARWGPRVHSVKSAAPLRMNCGACGDEASR